MDSESLIVSGGSTFYHLTSPESVPLILKKGLLTYGGSKGLSSSPRRGKVFLVSGLDDVGAFLGVFQSPTRLGLLRDYALLQVRVPKSTKIYIDHESTGFYTTKSIPPRGIKLLGIVRPAGGSYDYGSLPPEVGEELSLGERRVKKVRGYGKS